MSTSPLPDSPRLFWKDSERGQAQLRLDERYQGHSGFRHLLLAESALMLMHQQTPPGVWHLRSAVVSCDTEPEPGVATIRTINRSIAGGSVLANVHLLQNDKPVLTCVGAYERRWNPSPSQPPPPAWLGKPLRLPASVEAWPELRDKHCRDASAHLVSERNSAALGGFVRHREDRVLGPHDLATLIEPWLALPDGGGNYRPVRELIFEMHSPMPPEDAEPQYCQVLVQERQRDADGHGLEANLWTFSGTPLATIYVRTRAGR